MLVTYESGIPPVMEWVLKACDLNKYVEIQDSCQMTLSDIQLRYADRVFRLYVRLGSNFKSTMTSPYSILHIWISHLYLTLAQSVSNEV
jgi:hypothetical protein